MASFESKAVKQTSALLEVKKFSLQRLEISVNKFIKVITIDIDRLQQHRLNVEKVSKDFIINVIAIRKPVNRLIS